MIIANPIYDVVFKYLLEDLDIAKDLLSTILGDTITHLTIKPQEELVKTEEGDIRIFRLDFKAVILLETGKEKTVLIELQKAKQSLDIFRFRKYLGKNYQEEEFKPDAKGRNIGHSLEIVTVYFLGFTLSNVPIPILKVQRNFINTITKESLKIDEDFINLLTHESYTIQIPRLKLKQQNEMEQILEVFSQEYVSEDKHHIDYQGNLEHPIVKKIVRRLTKAAADENLLHQMEAEDAVDRLLIRQRMEYEEKIQEKEAIIGEKEAIIGEKEAIIAQERAEKEQILAELAKLKAFLAEKKD
ncbi:MAG: hypothetical protein JNL70_13105 [Saprospiraceae bacterium]|nr:hypothetical protein [Saprospiraceae bacterium]